MCNTNNRNHINTTNEWNALLHSTLYKHTYKNKNGERRWRERRGNLFYPLNPDRFLFLTIMQKKINKIQKEKEKGI